MMHVANLVAIALLISGFWWLSRYDSHVTGEDVRADFARRAIRCGITLLLLLLAVLGGFLAVPLFILIGVIWASPGAEFFARQFHKLFDPEDNRPFDPKQTERKLDLLGKLVREKRADEALALCDEMEKSREASPMALETTLHQLYHEIVDSISTSLVLAEARGLCERNQFEAAEAQLKQILVTQQKNWAAMLLLLRVYAEGMAQPNKALAWLEPVNKPSPLYHGFIKFARRSIEEWSGAVTPPLIAGSPFASSSQIPAAPVEVSLDDLLKNRQLATAVELLEKAIAEQPRDFDLRLKLMEVYAVHCSDPNRAGKIIQKMQGSATFSAAEIDLAKAKLKEWQTARA